MTPALISSWEPSSNWQPSSPPQSSQPVSPSSAQSIIMVSPCRTERQRLRDERQCFGTRKPVFPCGAAHSQQPDRRQHRRPLRPVQLRDVENRRRRAVVARGRRRRRAGGEERGVVRSAPHAARGRDVHVRPDVLHDSPAARKDGIVEVRGTGFGSKKALFSWQCCFRKGGISDAKGCVHRCMTVHVPATQEVASHTLPEQLARMEEEDDEEEDEDEEEDDDVMRTPGSHTAAQKRASCWYALQASQALCWPPLAAVLASVARIRLVARPRSACWIWRADASSARRSSACWRSSSCICHQFEVIGAIVLADSPHLLHGLR